MPTSRPARAVIRSELAALSGVGVRRMFGTEAYFAGTVMFAFLAGEELVLRLPEGPREAALDAGRAQPWLGTLPVGLSGWVVVALDAELGSLVHAAHGAARGMARSAARKARRSGRSARPVGSE
jgi:TfoX/Sxy family transcriptional regulator of competence genes